MCEKRKQINGIIEGLESRLHTWQIMVEEWAETQKGPIPSLPNMVEDLLHSLRGLDADLAKRYDWMLIV